MTDITIRASALTFQNTTFDVVDHNGDPWLRGLQIGGALGYARPDHAIWKLYETHKDEFTDSMTCVVKIPTEGGEQDVRIFSPRGCYALAMFARTKVAKEFRRWVLDVLESIRTTGQYIAQPYSANPTDTLTVEQADVLRQLLTDAAKARFPDDGKKQGAFLMRGWSRLKAHFKVGYREIPQAEFSEAVSLLARHVAQGEVLDAEPSPGLVTKEHAMRCLALVSSLTGPAHLVAFNQLLDQPERDLMFGRFLLAFNGDTPIVQAIEEDAVVLSWKEAPKILLDPGMAVDSDTLKGIALAAIDRLSRRVPQRNAPLALA